MSQTAMTTRGGQPRRLRASSAGLSHLPAVGALILALTLLGPAAAWAQTLDFSWRATLPQGRTIEIKGVNGAIYAVPATGTEVEVVATKSARKSNPDEVTFEVLEHDEGVTICALYPGRPNRPNECRPGERGRMEVRNNDVEVEFTVRVPRGVHFVGRTVNGDVEALALQSDTRIHTVNGAIRLATEGVAAAATVNGSITATVGRADWEGTVEFKTVNGGIKLELPEAISAEFSAKTVNGDITTDFPIQVQGRFSPRTLQGVIGEGGPRRLEVRTVNGSIQLRKASRIVS